MSGGYAKAVREGLPDAEVCIDPSTSASSQAARPTTCAATPAASRRPRAALAPDHLAAWLGWASRSKLKPFVKLARTIRRHREASSQRSGSGSRTGDSRGLNSKLRPISHRSFGFHSAAPLVALVYLCCGGLVVTPPLR